MRGLAEHHAVDPDQAREHTHEEGVGLVLPVRALPPCLREHEHSDDQEDDR